MPEFSRTSWVAIIAVSLTALSIMLTILLRTAMELSGTKERVVAMEREQETIRKEMAVIREDIKHLIKE